MSDFTQMLEQLIEERLAPLRARIAELEAENQKPTQPLAFTVAEVCEKFLRGVPESTAREWIRDGKLKGHLTPGGRVYLVYYDDLQAFLQALKTKQPEVDERQERVASNVTRILSKHRAS